MNTIFQVTDNIYQGGYPDGPLPADISAVINLTYGTGANSADYLQSSSIKAYSWLPIPDGPSPGQAWLYMAVGLLNQYVKIGYKVYIHCLAGHSRSVLVTAAFLIERYKWSAERALAEIARYNTSIDLAPAFRLLLDEFANGNVHNEDYDK